ncbi:helix-turn-helix domain-containing protein [Amycolatopsis sp. CA-230715]|uniref:PucR family transcriptional regulator n=1 Tax=Amycolatopsis sp. CA-230715 TaxID=2745196 RepID=UPI001C33DDC0|nr:helix-turn-helix domain-containing protein [Amycolatopsis sp. CA-230715]QWF83745.1 hypothetical protein HUW46_07188 [Amycolatopsis sp. CA-230715]
MSPAPDHRDESAPTPDATFDPMLAPPRAPGDSTRIVQLWSLLPSELSTVFRPKVSDVAGEILTEIQQAVPEYARPVEGAFGKLITAGVQEAILTFLDRLGDPSAVPPDRGRVFQLLGRHELNQGRNLDVLQTAYRVGARVAWRRMAEVGAGAGVPIPTLCLLAEAIFAYLDEMSALSIEGHAAAQAREAGALHRRRRRLMDMLMAEPPVSAQALAELAGAAEWELPEQVVVVALEPTGEPASALPDDVLVDLESDAPSLVVPSPTEVHELETLLPGCRMAIGPRVRLSEAAKSYRWARRALDLVASGALPDSKVTWCDDHLSDLWLLNESFLIDQLANQVLAPLSELKGAHRDRLSQTLLTWLETRGNVKEIASSLSIHPQTVRARMHELESLFGTGLRDPQLRFELMLALRSSMRLGSDT